MSDQVEPVAEIPVESVAVEAQPNPVEPPVEQPVVEEPTPPQEHGNKGKKPWFLDRISEESNKRAASDQRAEAAERRAAEAEALLSRLQSSNDPPSQARQNPSVDRNSPEFRKAVQEDAAAARFFDDTSAVRNAGLQKFGAQFENDLNILTAVGATSNDVVADILAVDKANAHILLNTLASDPERAAVIAKMDTRTRIAELTRMQMVTAQPAPSKEQPKVPTAKQVSRAPAPPPPVEPSAAKTVDWRSDDVSDAEFSRGWEENMRKRQGAGR